MKNGSTRVGMSLCLARRRRPTRRAIPIGEILEESKFTLIGIIPSALTFDRSPIIVTARRSRGGPGGAIGPGSGSPGSPHPQAGARDDGQRSIVRALGIICCRWRTLPAASVVIARRSRGNPGGYSQISMQASGSLRCRPCVSVCAGWYHTNPHNC